MLPPPAPMLMISMEVTLMGIPSTSIWDVYKGCPFTMPPTSAEVPPISYVIILGMLKRCEKYSAAANPPAGPDIRVAIPLILSIVFFPPLDCIT